MFFVFVLEVASITAGRITSKIGRGDIFFKLSTATDDAELHAITIALTFLEIKNVVIFTVDDSVFR